MKRRSFDRLSMFGLSVGTVLVAGNLLRWALGQDVHPVTLLVGVAIVAAVALIRRRYP